MEKVTFQKNENETIEYYILEQTRISGVNYLLETDVEEGDGEALILKDLSKPEEPESVFAIVEDEKELDAVAKVFEELLDDVEFV